MSWRSFSSKGYVAGPMQFSDDGGERIADTGHFSQAVFRNRSIKRLCRGFEALLALT
jgi:hypothetical protein